MPTFREQNAELMRCIEELRTKKSNIEKEIKEEEAEKMRLNNDITVLVQRLDQINESLSRKLASQYQYTKIIKETELAYSKILESSQTLLKVIKRESINISKR